MSLQYIIDGYNIINHSLFIGLLNKKIKKIEDSRIALLEFIRINRLCGSPKNKITVVFDGHFDLSGLKRDLDGINVISSKEETADKKISRMVEESANPKNIVVVSDDKEIKFFVKSMGARWVGVEEFINLVDLRKQKQKDLLIKPELTYSQIRDINEELKKIWLK